jgi:hypothetical protein
MTNTVEVAVIPPCDLCKLKKGRNIPATVDGATVFGMWGYLCNDCYHLYGVGIGVGQGQLLVLKTVANKRDPLETPAERRMRVASTYGRKTPTDLAPPKKGGTV